MKAIFLRAVVVFTSLSAIVAAMMWDGRSTNAQPAQPKMNAVELRESYGAKHCGGCHNCKDDTLRDYQKEDIRGCISANFVKLNEYSFWKDQDLHSKAFENIDPAKSGLAGQMQRVLSKDPHRSATANGNYQITKAGECLACHAVDLHWDAAKNQPPEINFKVVNDEANPRFWTDNGVSCEACHGNAKEWFAPHVNSSWRDVDVQKKTEKGLVNLRSPKARAEKCASCHVGNKDEGKFVTHDMYAAGHPPLQAFELATYCADQPAHYLPSHKNKELLRMAQKKDAEFMKKNFQFRKDELSSVRELAVGSVSAFRANMNLLAAEATSVGNNPSGLLDFALFDCAACHHDLKYPSDRQNRDKGVPGRPLPKVQTELLEAVLSHAEKDGGNPQNLSQQTAKLRENIDLLHAAFDDRPFGNSEMIKKIAGELAQNCDAIITALDEVVYDKAKAQKLEETIAERIAYFSKKNKDGRSLHYLDHDGAQQLAWALLAIRSDLHPDEKSSELSDARSELAKKLVLDLRERNMEGAFKLEPVAGLLKKRSEMQYSNYSSDSFIDAMSKWIDIDKKNP